jgi:hypothetical protein
VHFFSNVAGIEAAGAYYKFFVSAFTSKKILYLIDRWGGWFIIKSMQEEYEKSL